MNAEHWVLYKWHKYISNSKKVCYTQENLKGEPAVVAILLSHMEGVLLYLLFVAKSTKLGWT